MATQEENTPRVGYQTIIWGPQIDDLEGVLEIIAKAGFKGVEFAQRPEMLRRHNDPRPLDIHDLLHLLEEWELALLGFAAGMLEERVRFCGDVRPEYLYVENWDPHSAPVAAANGFALALHPHVFKVIHRVTDAMELLEAHPELRFLPDTAHLTIAGDDPAEAVRRISDPPFGVDRLIGVHLKDWTPEFGRSSHRYAQGFTELGEGIIRLDAVIEELDKANFSGWLIVEQDATKENPQVSILKCAQWLAERDLTAKEPEESEREVERARAPRADRKKCDSRSEMHFVRSVFSASGEPIERCYRRIVDAFMELIPCKLATLWACNQANNFLSLLAISPRDVSLPRYVFKYDTALSGIAIERGTVTEFDLRSPSPYPGREYQPRELTRRLGLTHMVSVPIFNPANHNHMPLLLNLFPKDEELPVSNDELFWFGMDVGRSVDIAIDESCFAAAGRASVLAGQSARAKDLLGGIRTLLHEHLGCQEIAIFLVSYAGDKLELVETTGTEWRVRREQQYYTRGEGLTGRVWERNEPLLTIDAVSNPHRAGKSVESLVPEDDAGGIAHDSYMIAPLVDAKGDVVGVVRCHDKETAYSSVFNMFSDDDVAVLDTISQATMPYLQVRLAEERYRRAVRRVTHELKTPIVAIRGAAQLMQAALKRRGRAPADFFDYDYVGDIWSWTEITQRLLGNADFLRVAEEGFQVHPDRTLLLKDVVAPAVRQVRPLLQERGFKNYRIQIGSFARVPALRVDKNLLQQVIFNLLSNAVKYAYDDPGAFQVEIQGEESPGRFLVFFRDWGPGIEESIREKVFEEGFRAPEASVKNVSGQGLGLWVVRQAVEAHGGEVEVTKCERPTEITIRLPASLQYYSPRRSRWRS